MKHLSNPLLWLLLAFSIYLVGQGAVGFIGPDEPRYADVARGMLESGDYVTPHLNGEPWFEKPPLYYWLAAGLFRLGANEIDARLPSALAACIFLAFWFRFTRKRFGIRTAALASMVLASTLGWVGFAHAAVMDMLFAATLDGALALLAVWFWRKEEQYLWGFYVLLGLATLAKGPVAIVLAGLIALAYVVTYKEWKTLWQTLYSPGLALFIVVAVPWYLLCYQRNGFVFIQDFFITHNLGRFTTPELGHVQPAWYFVPIVAAGLFPWTPLLLIPVVEMFRSGTRSLFASRERTFLFCWVAIVFLFFSLSKNKLPSYVLPLLPPLTLWIAMLVEKEQPEVAAEQASKPAKKDRSEKRSAKSEEAGEVANRKAAEVVEANALDKTEDAAIQKLTLLLIGLSALLLLAIPLGVPLLADSLWMGLRQALAASSGSHFWSAFRRGPVPPVALLLLVIPVGVCFYMIWRRDVLLASFMVLVGVAMTVLGIVGYVSPSINRVASVRSVAQRMQVYEIAPGQLAASGLRRDQSLALNFYMGYKLPEWDAKTSPATIAYIIANDEVKISEAHPMVLFPGQHLRLWVMPPSQFDIQIETDPKKGTGL